MFTIEHEFDATVVTLVDDGSAPLQEDVVINSFAEVITVEQYDPADGQRGQDHPVPGAGA